MSLAEFEQPAEGRASFFLKQSANIYSMMLILSLLFIIVGCLFMFLEWKAYDLKTTVPADAKAPQAMWSPAPVQFEFSAVPHAARMTA